MTTLVDGVVPGPGCARCSALEDELADLRAVNAQLRSQLETLQKSAVKSEKEELKESLHDSGDRAIYSPFSKLELQRYGRQMLVKEFGVTAQLKLRAASVLLVGAGGLGSPVAMYLAAMGVGTLAVVDDDRVDHSNLHRQVLHDEQAASEREKKVLSAQRRLREMNPLVRCVVHATRFTAANALELVGAHDVVVDASDNVGTRYLVNDACARLHKPLVSGSALGMEGQVTVFTYQNDENAAGCYRCLYPTPPRVAMSCADNGVIGVVPGVIGCLQAMETVKVITGVGEPLVGIQCFYDAYDGKFRHLKIGKKRNPNCLSCGSVPREPEGGDIKPLDASLLAEGICDDHAPCFKDLDPKFRISAEDFAKVRNTYSMAEEGKERTPSRDYALLDTRAYNQFEMVHFPEAVNIPFTQLMKQNPVKVIDGLQRDGARGVSVFARQAEPPQNRTTFVICRRGVDSVTVTRWLVRNGLPNVRNVDGGYTECARDDPEFPMY